MGALYREGLIFAGAVLSGMTVYSFYRCLALLRRLIRHSPAAVEAEDFLFWTATAVYTFVQIYHTNNGRVRWYYILGLVLGVLLMTVLSKTARKLRKKLYGRTGGKSSKMVE